MHTTNREKSLPHKLRRFASRLCSVHALLVQHLYSVFFQYMFGMIQHQKQFGCRECRKIG